MRNQILVALLGMATMLAGCSQEENVVTPSDSKTASFTLAVNDGVDTRAVTEPAVKPTRYIMEVYEGITSKDAAQATQVEQTGNTFDVILKDGQDYTILFWADYGTAKATDNAFDASKLREVKIATGKTATQAAFAGVVQFKVGTDDASKYTAVTLTHAVAQVHFKQTGTLTATPTKLAVKYPESYSLNVDGSAVTKIAGEVTHELTCNAVTTDVIATDYIIASNDDKTIMNIEATLDSEAKKEISNAPFRCNYTTTISGAYSDKYSATLTVSCDDDWSTPDNDADIESSITWAEGNLVADGTNGAKVGTATDGGLFFQFGSLIGWSSEGDLKIVVQPANFNGSTDWADTGKIWQGETGTVPSTVAGSNSNDEKAGIGDPCSYYLKGTWRLPTVDEYKALFNNITQGRWTDSGGWSWTPSPASAIHTDGKKFMASGLRSSSGSLSSSLGNYWSASPKGSASGYSLGFYSSVVSPGGYSDRVSGLSVRCVR